jgi:hypothetical protein
MNGRRSQDAQTVPSSQSYKYSHQSASVISSQSQLSLIRMHTQ